MIEEELLDGAFSFVTVPLQRRLQVYPSFNNPNDLFNQEAPSNVATFIIGGVLFVIGFFMYIHRVRKLMENSRDANGISLTGVDFFRGMLAVLNDNDSSIFTIISFQTFFNVYIFVCNNSYLHFFRFYGPFLDFLIIFKREAVCKLLAWNYEQSSSPSCMWRVSTLYLSY